MKRSHLLPLVALAPALTGCLDLGLEGNIPLERAADRPPSELVAAVYAPTMAAERELVADGRLWVPDGLPHTLGIAELRAVGSANGRTLYARSWDDAPYDALFTELPAEGAVDEPGLAPLDRPRWLVWAPVIGRTGPGATAEHGDAGAAHDEAPHATETGTAAPPGTPAGAGPADTTGSGH